MAVFLTEDFSGTPGTDLISYNPAWSYKSDATQLSRITTSQKLRFAGGSAGISSYQHNLVSSSPDSSVSGQFTVVSNIAGVDNEAELLLRVNAVGDGFYSLRARASNINQLQISVSVPGNFFSLGVVSWTYTVGIPQTLKLEVIGNALKVYRAGSVIFSITDSRLPAAGTIGMKQAYGAAVSSDGVGIHLDNIVAEVYGGVPQDLNVTPGKVNARASVPTFTSSVSNLNVVPAYASAYVSVPSLVAEAYPLNVSAARVNARAGVPSLIGGATFFNAPAAFIEAHTSLPYLVSGQGIEAAPARVEAYAAVPELVPGPVERTTVPAYAGVRVAAARVTMEIRLDPDAVFVEVHARRPTLKNRFSCGTIAPLQDRLRARVSQDGGAGCSVGVRGSDGFVKW